MGLPATGSVSQVLGDYEIMKPINLSWNNKAMVNVCDGTPPVYDAQDSCLADAAYHNASAAAGTAFGADLGWFTLVGDCGDIRLKENEKHSGLCFMLANDMVADNAAGIASTLVASVDSGIPSAVSLCPMLTPVQTHTRCWCWLQLGSLPSTRSSCFGFRSRSEQCWRRSLKKQRRRECE